MENESYSVLVYCAAAAASPGIGRYNANLIKSVHEEVDRLVVSQYLVHRLLLVDQMESMAYHNDTRQIHPTPCCLSNQNKNK